MYSSVQDSMVRDSEGPAGCTGCVRESWHPLFPGPHNRRGGLVGHCSPGQSPQSLKEALPLVGAAGAEA